METLLLNDTSYYHYGCKQVIKTLKQYYNPVKLCHTEHTISNEDLESVDTVVLNGEGTLHHNSKNAVKFLTYIRTAQEMNKSTHIVNTVWQEMNTDWRSVLMKCDVLEVREILSQTEMQCNATIVLDASIHLPTEKVYSARDGICVGGSFFGEIKVDIKHETINIFTDSWDDLVKKLQSVKLLITGRHHEMYAALKARTPVIAVSGNSWKNEGFFHTTKTLDLILQPTTKNIIDTIEGKYDTSWQSVWDFLDESEYKYKDNTRSI